MEGPLCDRCLDANELLPTGIDRYWHLRDSDEACEYRAVVCDEIGSQHDVAFYGRPLLVVDLVSKRVLYYSGTKTKPIHI